MSSIPWAPAVATSVGSFPGTSPLETARIVAGELPDFVHVAELPARGPGADMIGRTGGMLTAVASNLALETTPQGWRFAPGMGKQMRHAQSFLGEDLDALEEIALGFSGPVKCQVVGPWTLAASIELRTGERALRDLSAVSDIAAALAEAVRMQVADLRRRMPRASSIVVQVDEPSLPAVLAGRIGTASGLSSYRAVDVQVAERELGRVFAAAGDMGAIAGIHCCAKDAPIDLVRAAGAQFVSLDFTLLEDEPIQDDALGRSWESGMGILAGCVPGTSNDSIGDARASAPLRNVLHRIGFDDAVWLEQVAITPACGLAGASPTWAIAALRACAAVGRVVKNDDREDEEPEERRRGSR